MFPKEIVSIAEESLGRLRQIRTRACEVAPSVFDEDLLHDAEELIDGLVGITLAYLNGKRGTLTALKQNQRQFLNDCSRTYRGIQESMITNANTATMALSSMDTLHGYASRGLEVMEPLLTDSKITTGETPGHFDIIVSPLSSGPLEVRFVHKLLHLPTPLVLAAVDPEVRKVDDERDLPRMVRMPHTASWPWKSQFWPTEKSRFFVVDDLVVDGMTKNSVAAKIRERYGVPETDIL